MVAGLQLAREALTSQRIASGAFDDIESFALNVAELGAALRKRAAAGDTMHAKCGAGRTRLLLFDGLSWSCR